MCECKKQDGCQELLIAKRGAASQTRRETGCNLHREPVWGGRAGGVQSENEDRHATACRRVIGG